MYCAKCGQQLPDDAVFCIKCGTKVTVSLNNQELDNNSIEDTTNTQQNSTQPSIPEENNINHDQQLTTGSLINKNIIYGVILLLLVAGYFIFNGDSNSDNNTRWRAYNGVEYAAKSSAGVDFSLIGVEEKELLISWSGNIVRPNGKFVIVSVYIFNDSDKPISVGVFEDPFQIWDKAQRKYNVVSISPINASLASGEKSLMFYEEINPGMGIKLEIPFDVPKNLDIHSSRFHAKFSYNGKEGSYEEGSISLPLKVVTKNKDLNTNNQGKHKDAHSGVPPVPSQSSEENYPNTDFFPPGSMRDRITGTGVNMRSGPGKEHNVIGSFDKGEIVVEIDNQMSKKDSWVQVRRKNGEVGWVCGQYCELVKDPKINYSKYINAVGILYDYHEAITKKDYKKAYNLLAPEEQKTSAPPDQFGQGYSNVISSTVMETYPSSTDGNTVSVEYLLEAKDKTPSGISVKYYKAFADLHRINGEWKIGQTSVGRGSLDRKTLLR